MTSDNLAIPITIITATIFATLGVLYVRRLRLTVEDFIVSRNTATGKTAVATVVASIAGAWILLSPVEAGTWAGITGLIGYAIGQASPLIAFSIIGPRMRLLMPNGHSLTEYVWHRFGSGVCLFVMGIMIFYMFVFLSAELTGIAVAMAVIADIPLWTTALIVMIGTLAYTTYGGIRSSIFTDYIQFLLIIPLLIIVFLVTIFALGGFNSAFNPVKEIAPQLLSLSFRPGIEFAVALIIAILSANMFHQGFWQRVYTCRDERTLRNAYTIGGVVIIPIIIIAGLFGIIAMGSANPPTEPSVAFFSLINNELATWAVMLVLILALVLVMSSMDTLLNGISSTITTELRRLHPGIAPIPLLRSSRVITVLVALPAVFIAKQGYSVLYLFLIADLVCAGSVFPVFFGLYNKRLTGTAALVSCIVGIVVGAFFFPKPDLITPLVNLPGAGKFMYSFGASLGTSSLLAIGWSLVTSLRPNSYEYDYHQLREQVHLIHGQGESSLR